jgi:hypothetical protein
MMRQRNLAILLSDSSIKSLNPIYRPTAPRDADGKNRDHKGARDECEH